MLLLRWMIPPRRRRRSGLWRSPPAAAHHPGRYAHSQSFQQEPATSRNDVMWRTAEEITAASDGLILTILREIAISRSATWACSSTASLTPRLRPDVKAAASRVCVSSLGPGRVAVRSAIRTRDAVSGMHDDSISNICDLKWSGPSPKTVGEFPPIAVARDPALSRDEIAARETPFPVRAALFLFGPRRTPPT
jgi:hypothetical protein